MENFGFRKYHQSEVSLYIRTTNNGARRYERINLRKPQLSGGVYCLHFYEQGKRKWETVGTDLNEAILKKTEKKAELLKAASSPATETPTEKAAVTLEKAIERYLKNIAAMKSQKTSDGYKYTLDQFKVSCKKTLLKDVNKQDLQDFVIYLKGEELSDRTIANRVGEIVTFLRAHDIKNVTLRHKYVEKKVRAYRPDELQTLFAAMTDDEWILFQFFLATGAREQEVMNAEWGDIDFVDGVFTVKAKAHWKPKDFEEREVPLPDYLVKALKKRMLETKGLLIFPGKNGKRNGHMLRLLQSIAKRAGLTPEDFGLHVFRKTFATLQHRAGVDARTIQRRLGHSALETTLSYLEGEDARSESTREKVNRTFGAFA